MRAKKKPSKKAALKKLHGALRSLLSKPGDDDVKTFRGVPEILPSSNAISEKKVKKPPSYSSRMIRGKGDRAFVVSKEDQLIPKLSDNEIMERHKLADENMRRVWTSIIQKYESLEDQGDVIDLQTCEVVEDNGHLRGLSNEEDARATRYESILKDVIDLKEGKNSGMFTLWGDDEVSEQEDDDYEIENGEEEEEDGEADYTDYNELLKKKIDD